MMTISVWQDAELEVDTGGMPNWLAMAALAEAYHHLEVLEELSLTEGDEEEEE